MKVAEMEIKERPSIFYENIGVEFKFSTCYENFTARFFPLMAFANLMTGSSQPLIFDLPLVILRVVAMNWIAIR